jgi:hypothetical protein
MRLSLRHLVCGQFAQPIESESLRRRWHFTGDVVWFCSWISGKSSLS